MKKDEKHLYWYFICPNCETLNIGDETYNQHKLQEIMGLDYDTYTCACCGMGVCNTVSATKPVTLREFSKIVKYFEGDRYKKYFKKGDKLF